MNSVSRTKLSKLHGANRLFNPEPIKADVSGNMIKERHQLIVEWGKKDRLVVVIGYRPSTACTGKSDHTITTVCRFVDMYGFNRLLMLNVYTCCQHTAPVNIQDYATDFSCYYEDLNKADAIILAYGVNNGDIRYLINDIIEKYKQKTYCIKRGEKHKTYDASRWRYSDELIRLNE